MTRRIHNAWRALTTRPSTKINIVVMNPEELTLSEIYTRQYAAFFAMRATDGA